MEPWRWSPVLKALIVAAAAIGYAALILSLFGVWKAL